MGTNSSIILQPRRTRKSGKSKNSTPAEVIAFDAPRAPTGGAK